MGTGSRLTVRELIAVRRFLGPRLSPAEQEVFTRSLRRHIIHLSVVAGLAIVLGTTILLDARQAYVLGFDPLGADKPPYRAGAGPVFEVRAGEHHLPR